MTVATTCSLPVTVTLTPWLSYCFRVSGSNGVRDVLSMSVSYVLAVDTKVCAAICPVILRTHHWRSGNPARY